MTAGPDAPHRDGYAAAGAEIVVLVQYSNGVQAIERGK